VFDESVAEAGIAIAESVSEIQSKKSVILKDTFSSSDSVYQYLFSRVQLSACMGKEVGYENSTTEVGRNGSFFGVGRAINRFMTY
jgi:hypothetical protein